MKGVDALIATVLVIVISISGILVVMNFAQPSVGRLQEISLFEEAKKILIQIDNAVKIVSQEGEGSTRVLQLSVSGGNYFIDTEKEAVVFSMESRSQIIGIGVSNTEGSINMLGELNKVLLNITYSNVNVTGGGKFGKGYYSLIIRNNGYDFARQKQIVSISLAPPVLPPTAFTYQYNQYGIPYTAKGAVSNGNYIDLDVLGEGLTYDISESEEYKTVSENFINCSDFGDGTSCYNNYWSWTSSNVNFLGSGENAGAPQNQVASNNITNLRGISYYGNHTQTFNVNSSVINNLKSAFLSFKYEPTIIRANSAIRIYLVKPDNSESLIWSTILTTSGSWINVNNINMTSNLTQPGNYKIKLWVNGVTGTGGAKDFKSRWDDINLTISWDRYLYSVDVWHNSSQIDEGNIISINATLNFTTNASDEYSLMIYDWLNSQWVSTGCDSGVVPADTATKWWCIENINPMNYNSSDNKIMIKINSTSDSNAGLLKEDYIQYYVTYIP